MVEAGQRKSDVVFRGGLGQNLGVQEVLPDDWTANMIREPT